MSVALRKIGEQGTGILDGTDQDQVLEGVAVFDAISIDELDTFTLDAVDSGAVLAAVTECFTGMGWSTEVVVGLTAFTNLVLRFATNQPIKV